MEYLGVALIGLIAAVIPGALMAYSVRTEKSKGVWSMVTLWGVFTGLMFIAMNAASGWDGLLYLFGLMLVSGPAAVGMFIGGIIGWVKREDTTDHAIAIGARDTDV